jgi:uncharacterized membrane protein YdbT with pleckstrin-like domain
MSSTLSSTPVSVNRYLLPHERLVISLHFHPSVLIGPVSVTLAGLAAAAYASNVLVSSPDAILSIWLTWGFILLYLIGRVGRWINDVLVLTSDRLLVVRGLLTHDVASIPNARAAGMKLRRSFTGRLLGYGHLIFETGGRDRAIRAIHFVPYPEQIYLELNGLIYPAPNQTQGEQPDPS